MMKKEKFNEIGGYDEREEYLPEYIKSMRDEIESLRDSLQAAEILLETHQAAEKEWWKRKYQILRDSMSDEEFAATYIVGKKTWF